MKTNNLIITFLIISVIFGCAVNRNGGNAELVKMDVLEKEVKNKKTDTKDNNLEIPSFLHNMAYSEISGFPEYIIGPGDAITIRVWKRREPENFTAVVSPDGKISFLYFEGLKVNGLTPTQADKMLTGHLKEYFKERRIDVIVKEFNSKSVFLIGAINAMSGVKSTGPGIYPLKGKTTLFDLLLTAGGHFQEADLGHIKLIREGKIYSVNLYELLTAGDESQNIILENKDKIMVPIRSEFKREKGNVYVLGAVNSPGIYHFKEDIGIVKALTMAGGYSSHAVIKSVKVIRGDIKDPTILTSDLNRFLKKSDISQNITVKNGDIIYVPTSSLKAASDFFGTIYPILQALLYPGLYRDLYTTGGGLRIDTGLQDTGTTILPSP
ncbi:MAG: SLBB domain-containing protein [Nitrospinota bacterium]